MPANSSISQITEFLYIAANPRADAVKHVHSLDVRLIISMIAIRPTRHFFKRPFHILILPTFDHPRLPIPVFILKIGVKAALAMIENGAAVLVYCREGRHRSVAMAACILIANGFTADEAMNLIMEKRSVADPHAPHIERQIRKFEAAWRNPQLEISK